MGTQEWTIAWLAQEDCNGEAIVDIMAQDLDLFVFNPSLKDIYQQVLAMREHARMQAQTQPAQAAHRPGRL